MIRRHMFGVVTCLLVVAAFGLVSSQPAEANLLLGGTRVYTTAGITVVVEGWLSPDLMKDPAAYLSFWALRSDQAGVQASDQRLAGGVVIPRGNAVRVKIYIEPGNDDLDREVVVQQYSKYGKFGVVELARFRGLYNEISLNTGLETIPDQSAPVTRQQAAELRPSSTCLVVGSNAIRIFMYGKKRNPQAYLGVGIVVAPNPEDVQRQAQLVTETGQGEYLVPQTPVRQQPAPQTAPIDPLDDGGELRRTSGTVAVTTNRATRVKLFVSGIEVASHDVRDRHIFENVPVGAVSIQMCLDGGRWTVKQPATQTLVDGGTVQFDLWRSAR